MASNKEINDHVEALLRADAAFAELPEWGSFYNEYWPKEYTTGELVDVRVYVDDDWSKGRKWVQAVVHDVGRFPGCLTVLIGNKTYYVNSKHDVRRSTTTKDDQCAKQDADKVDWGLLFPHVRKALEAVVAVRAYGAKKYGESESWKTVDAARYKKAAMRHLIESLGGATTNEKDGGCHHLAQAACDILFALELELKEGK